ncbi:transcription factor IIIA [Xylaria bambusicola]|uniref:transcription factor IIIA n=1 Tax=Xylaria bambusicola TaxID=326684 RepID=UPI002008732D|nr:transcription factor IIIA [Xylaria bambusicola]KAI0527758.1 transcription factor IIIA [Xylaria bambusicola]
MKRAASQELEDPPLPKKGRTAAPAVLPEDAGLKLELNEDISDTESHYTESPSAGPADTPLTPLSPARKWPSDLKTIKCTYPDCNKTFNRPARLAAHLRSHNNERPFVCPYPDCDKNYIEEKHLKQHIKGSHTAERDHICTYEGCGKKFMTATRLRRHQLVHEGQERFKCRDFPPCNQSFRKHQTLQRHIRTEHQHKPAFQCSQTLDESGSLCGQGFDTAGALRRHQERDHGENRFWCEECATQPDETGNPRRVGFPTLVLLQAHMKTSHIKCMFCGESCNGREDLDRHIESDHANRKTVEERKTIACTWPGCTKTFTRTSNMYVHIRSAHEGARTFVCGEFDLSKTADLATWSNSQGCGQAFALKAALEKHVRYVHLMHDRPQQNLPGASISPQAHADPTMLEQLTGVGEKSRATLPCTFSGCHTKFTYSGELEAHIQKEHQIEQALLDGLEDFGTKTEPSSALRDVTQGITEWEADYGGEDFWVGADMTLMALNADNAGIDEEWLRDEAEMRKLIGPDELNGLIDPSLG